MPRFQYWACCMDLPGELVQFITDDSRAQQITYGTFVRHADVGALRTEGHPATYRMSRPDNWAISFWKSTLPSGHQIYFFDWSRIEHVFVKEPIDLGQERKLLECSA